MTVTLLAALLILENAFAGHVLAGGPLPVVYPDDDDEIVESPQSYINNQAYLQEFERQRRERVLARDQTPPSVVISSKRERYQSSGINGYNQSGSDNNSRFFGVEYQSGDTVIRYYDGYQPHCCFKLRYYVRPDAQRRRPVPYHHTVSN